MMFHSTENSHNTVIWRNNANDLTDLDDDLDNELPLSSIADFEHPFNNLEVVRNAVKTTDCQTKQKIKQDNKLPHPSIPNCIHPIYENKIIKPRSEKYETVDHQIELDIEQDNKLPLSSIADFLHPIDHKFKNGVLQKYKTVNHQTEENNSHNKKLTLSSITHSSHPFDNKFIEHGAVDCQSKENINHYNKPELNRLIYNNYRSTVENLLKTYECDICGKIFHKRTDIIKHFKISLCFPEIVYVFDFYKF